MHCAWIHHAHCKKEVCSAHFSVHININLPLHAHTTHFFFTVHVIVCQSIG